MTKVRDKDEKEFTGWCNALNKTFSNDSYIEWLQFEKDLTDLVDSVMLERLENETNLITNKK